MQACDCGMVRVGWLVGWLVGRLGLVELGLFKSERCHVTGVSLHLKVSREAL